MYVPVREHYAKAPYHHGNDLALVEEIVRDRHPEMIETLEKYLSGPICYFGNIFIMKKTVFHDYCAWLFPVLEEFDRRADTSGHGPQERRVDGYLTERMLGAWAEWQREQGRILLELPRIHFIPQATRRRRKQILNALLPPGSKRRAMVKRIRKP